MERLEEFKDLGNGSYLVKFKSSGGFFHNMGGILEGKYKITTCSDYMEGEVEIGLADLPFFVSWYLTTQDRRYDEELKELLLKVLNFEEALQDFIREEDFFLKVGKFRMLSFAGFDFFGLYTGRGNYECLQKITDAERKKIFEDLLFVFDMVGGSLGFWKCGEFLSFRFLINTEPFLFYKVEDIDDYSLDLVCDVFKTIFKRHKSNHLKYNLLLSVIGSCESFSKFVGSLVENDKNFKSYIANKIKRSDIGEDFVPLLPDSLKSIYARKVLLG